MATQSIPRVLAQVELESLTDTKGTPVMLLRSTAEHYRTAGMTSVMIEVQLCPKQLAESWLTVTEAAQLAVAEEIVFGWTVANAKSCISRDCSSGRIRSKGENSQRRVDPGSLRAWLLDRRRRENARDEAAEYGVPPRGEVRRPVSISEAARQHLDDVDNMTFDKARARIRRACETGRIASTGIGRQRRIDSDSLAAWRLNEREKNLRRSDLGL